MGHAGDMSALDPFSRDVVLSDGGVLRIRPVRPEDRAGLAQLHDHDLSDTSAYYRFFGIRPHLTAVFLDRVIEFDLSRQITIVAERGDRIVAAGSYNKDSDDAVEVAFAVADDYQGLGIGTVLLEDLAVLAHASGFHRLVAHTLPGNRPMIDVFARVGLRVRHRLEEGVVDIEIDLSDDEQLLRRADEREWAAQARSMQPFVAPRSVVVIGAGREPTSPGHRVVVNAKRTFTGSLAVVRPDGAAIADVPGYRAVRDVPFAIDLAVIAVPAAVTPQVLEECGQAGVKGVVVITAGFSETGTEAAITDRHLVEIAHRWGMRMVGPNCFGIIASSVGLDATFSAVPAVGGGVAFGSQSGGLGIAVLHELAERGMGISSFVSLGNRADVSSNDLLCVWADDPNTRVIMLYLESVGNPRRFLRIARHVAGRKPIVVLKSGRTASGRRGAASHTAALASDDAALDALFDAAGVIRVDTLEELLDTAQLLDRQRAPEGPRVALIGNAGGPLILAADASERAGLTVPALGDDLQASLRRLVPNAAATSNPVDLLATVTPDRVADSVAVVAASGEVDAIVVAAVGVRPDDDSGLRSAWSSSQLRDRLPIPVVMSIAGAASGGSQGSVFRYSESAVASVGRAYRWWRRTTERELRSAERDRELGSIDWAAVRRYVRSLARESGWLSLDRAGQVLHVAGIAPVPSAVAGTPAEAARLAAEIAGDTGAVVLKAIVPGLLHKTEAGALALDVRVADVETRAREFVDRFPTLTGVYVQQRVAPGPELLIGGRQDPSAGPLVVVAAGGVEAELLADRSIHAAPLDRVVAATAIRGLRTGARFTGFRGRPSADVDAAAMIVTRVSQLVAAVPEIVEFEINPVVVGTTGASPVDTRIRLDLDAAIAVPLRGNRS